MVKVLQEADQASVMEVAKKHGISDQRSTCGAGRHGVNVVLESRIYPALHRNAPWVPIAALCCTENLKV